MATEQTAIADLFRSVCSDFYVNQKLELKLDNPRERQPVLELFDRLRRQHPELDQLRQYQDELALESVPGTPEQKWIAVRDKSVRSGCVNCDRMIDAYTFHQQILELSPFFLSINPLDVQYVELLIGFDLLAPGNHNEIVRDAFFAEGPLAGLMNEPSELAIDIQPAFGLITRDETNIEVHFEVKTRNARANGLSPDALMLEPISVYITARKTGSVSRVQDLATLGATLARRAEQIVTMRAVPHLIEPLRRAIGLY